MKSLQATLRTLLFRSAVLAIVAVMSASAVIAENVSLTLNLITPADPNTNRADVDFRIEVPAFSVDETEMSMTDLSGSVVVDLDIDFASGTNEATVNTISLGAGSLGLTDMSVSFSFMAGAVPVAVQVDSVGLSGFVNTPGSPSAVDGLGEFAAAEQQAVLNAGTVTTTPLLHPALDFSVDQLMELLAAGTAEIDVTKGSLVGLDQTYDVLLTLPFAFTSINDVEILGFAGTESVALDGTLVATGSFVRAVPEPTSILLSIIGAVLAIFIVRRM